MTIGAGAIAAGIGVEWAMSQFPSYDEAAQATWSRRDSRQDDDFQYLVHYATLAANSHNTQPWQFSRSDARVVISSDMRRATPVVDPDGHHLFASLGCAAENLMLAAAASGRSAGLRFAAEGGGRIEIDFAARTSARDPLFDAIVSRQCTRSLYDGSTVSADDLAALSKAAAVDGCDLILIPERARMEQALDLVVAANTAQVEDTAFRAELKSWLRFDAASAVATRDGLYSGCTGNPTMPNWLGNLLFGFAFKASSENDRYARQIRSSAGLAVFVGARDNPEHWVQAGRSYQRFALAATTLGLRHAFINQPVEVAALRPEFAKWLGIGDRRPDLIVRYGRAAPMPRSLRRPVQDVLVGA